MSSNRSCQIRFVTKSGSNRYSGSASFFYRDESLQANSWSRNRSTNPVENSGPAPFYATADNFAGYSAVSKIFFASERMVTPSGASFASARSPSSSMMIALPCPEPAAGSAA